MPSLDVRIYCGIDNSDPATVTRTMTVSQEVLEELIPPTPSGGAGGWGYWREAESLVASILKEELFQDERTPVESADDLRRLGVTSLKAMFENEARGSMGMDIIHPQ